MEGTSSTPHLLTDVRFSVSRKGYDPDEVDNFLERVSAAVAQLQDKLRQSAAQAEDAEARATQGTRVQGELQARVATLEEQLAGGAGSEAGARSPEDDVAQASTVLVMAQRTADATTEEARATAATTITDAQAKASTLVSDAEGESARLLALARAEADEIVNRRREALAEEIRGLEGVRDAVAADVAALEWHVGEQRGVLQQAVTRVQNVLDDPSSFHVTPAPQLAGASLSDVSHTEVAPVPTDDTSGASTTAGGPSSTADSTPASPTPTPTSTPEPTPILAAEDSAPSVDDGPPTMAHPAPKGPEDPSLGPPDEEADAAMKAFFEAEFDDDPGRGPR